jgi:hypothetical protein
VQDRFSSLGPRPSNKKNKDKNDQRRCSNNQHLARARIQIRFAKASKAFWTSVRVKALSCSKLGAALWARHYASVGHARKDKVTTTNQQWSSNAGYFVWSKRKDYTAYAFRFLRQRNPREL